MGILKIVPEDKRKKKSSSSNISSISFSISQDLSYQRTDLKAPYFWRNVLFALISGIIICSVLFLFSTKTKTDAEKHYAYFEIHVTNDDSQPVVGAKIYNKTNLVGVTDLYGQWRRFMKVKPQSKVSFIVKKDGASIKKTFTIPENISKKEKKSSFFGKIQIKAKGYQAPLSKSIDQVISEKQKLYESVWVYINEAQSHIALDDGIKISQLKQYVMPNIKKIIEDEGLIIDRSSEWKIQISHVEDSLSRSKGVIRVKSNQIFFKDDESIDFLMNYTGNGEKTAQNLLLKIKDHMKYPFLLKKSKTNSWYGVQPESDFWSIKTEKFLYSNNKKILQASKNNDVLRFFSIKEDLPCQEKETQCEAISIPPQKTEIIKISGYDQSYDVFVSGVKAQYEEPSTWRFTPSKDENPYLTIIQGDIILERQPFFQQKEISFQKSNKSQKEPR